MTIEALMHRYRMALEAVLEITTTDSNVYGIALQALKLNEQSVKEKPNG